MFWRRVSLAGCLLLGCDTSDPSGSDEGASTSGSGGSVGPGSANEASGGASSADSPDSGTSSGDSTDKGGDETTGGDEPSPIDPDRPTFYVSVSGDDANPGTEEAPWRTVQHGVNAIAPGDQLVALDGDFDENVIIDRDGESEARLSVIAATSHGAKIRSVVIRGDYVDLIGFEVEAGLEELTGVFVDDGHEVVVQGCYVHDCPLGGIDVSGSSIAALSTDVTVVDNLAEHNGQWGIHIVGSRILVEDNEIAESVQHHPKGDPPNFTGADADGLRVFGDNHIIRGNFIHDIADPADAEHNIDPHADCIQTWDRQDQGGRPVMTHSVIERNRCIIQHPSGKGLMMSAIHSNACHHITVRNNIFEFRDEGVEASQGMFHDIYIYNNVFKANLDDTPWGVSVNFHQSAGNYDVRNNIIVDCHAEARSISSADGIVDHNLVWYSDGSAPSGTPGPMPNELWGVDPMFVDYDGSPGGDYRLRDGSPAIDAGTTIEGVDDDHDGNARPDGGSHDIGAYER